jgi:hypothetical protein
MRPEDWLGYMRREYLSGFIPQGGAAAKFCVPLDDDTPAIIHQGLRNEANSLGYIFAEISAAKTRTNLIDHIFFRIAEQIDWRQLARRVLVSVCKANSFEVSEPVQRPFLEEVAERNGMPTEAALMLLREKVIAYVFKRRDLSRDFRVAMLQLCLAELTGGADADVRTPILLDWLTGRNRNISAVKPYNIFSRISRTNARHFIESLFQWVRIAGYPGTIVSLDLARLAMARNPRDNLQYYTTSALMDVYEVLREFIDATDRLSAVLMVVVPHLLFLDEDNAGRGLGRYEALKFRIFDEIRDRQAVNPMASLVRLSLCCGG